LAEAFTSLDSCKEGFSNGCSLDRRSSVIFTFILFLIFIFKTSTSSDQCSASRQQPQKMESSHLIQLRFLPNKGSSCFATPAVKKRRRKRQFHPSALSAGS
jgi:integral membrane sensor domain MASE1